MAVIDPYALPDPVLEWGAAAPVTAALALDVAGLPPAAAGIVAALGPYTAHAGRKWHVCGAVGGLMRKLGFSRDACRAVIGEWLAGAPAHVNVIAGCAHAVGAWAKDAEVVSGFDALAELVGAEHAELITEAATLARRAARPKPTGAPVDIDTHDPGGTPADPSSDDAPALPVFVMTPKGRDVWHYDPRTGAYRECARESLHVALTASGADGYVATTEKGKRLSPQMILDNGPTAFVREAITDFGREGEAEYDPTTERMLLGVRCPTITPVRDAGVHAWLAALAGDAEGLAALEQWIASTSRAAIHRCATALCLVGPHSSGKSLFALACARLWGSTPVALSHVAAQFNATMARCPIVFDDECSTLAKRQISTEDFRVLIQDRTRDYEPKGKERRTLIGAQRFILAANDIGALTFSNAIGVGAADAIAERLTVLQVPRDDTRAAVALEVLRDANGGIDFARLDGHLEWIRQTIALPDERTRFLGARADRGTARAAVVASVIADNEALFERLRARLAGEAPDDRAVFVARGSVWVKCEAFAEVLASVAPAERWDARRLRVALAAFRGASTFVRLEGATVRAWELDAVRLVEALGVDVDAAIAVLSAEVPAGGAAPATGSGARFKRPTR
jgi:hypothetical protein